jgi:hypothetical protein
MLDHLAASMASGDPAVIKDGDRFRLQTSKSNGVQDAREVLSLSQEILTTLSGIARIELGATAPLRVADVQRVHADGRRDIFVFPEPGVLKITGGLVTMKITRQDGSVEHHRPADRAARWIRGAHTDPDVMKALRLRNASDRLDWSELYKIFEIIRDSAGGESKIDSMKWATAGDMTRFRRTAHSPAVSGDSARHGVQKEEPPPHPMTPEQGRAFIDGVLKHWLEWIAAGKP